MIKVDFDQFMEDGYLIVRDVVPPDMLQPLRDSAEEAIRRQWPDGVPHGCFQPWIRGFGDVIDEDTANLVQMMTHENVIGVAEQLMPQAECIGIGDSFLMCNPIEEHGPWYWHRDITPETKSPLEGLQQDFLANEANYIHFNIALYHDDVYWIVPGSHKRLNTDEENRQLSAVGHSYAHKQQPQTERRHTPLPGSICAELQPGDMVVNPLEMLHWGSKYGTKIRRTYHFGCRAFGGPSAYYQSWSLPRYIEYLSPEIQERFHKCAALNEIALDNMEAALRGILQKDEAAFKAALARWHPGETGRFVAVIFLCKNAQMLNEGKNPSLESRFTPDEVATLWERFTPLDQALQLDGDELDHTQAFLIPAPSRYRLNEMPPDFGMEEFVASW